MVNQSFTRSTVADQPHAGGGDSGSFSRTAAREGACAWVGMLGGSLPPSWTRVLERSSSAGGWKRGLTRRALALGKGVLSRPLPGGLLELRSVVEEELLSVDAHS